jgi:geranylgeranyl diphosphate synthase, type II
MSGTGLQDNSFKEVISGCAAAVNDKLSAVLENHGDIHPRIAESMGYSLGAGGKRLRGGLVLLCCELTGGAVNEDALTAAAAVEMVHTYSLIHDDLPAMDDDDMRRGKPSCHKAFDEATAILAGDGLLSLAFEILADDISDSAVSAKMVSELCRAAGPGGMIAGQMADIEAEQAEPTAEALEYIHKNKTAKMIRCSAVLGALAGRAGEQQIAKIGDYGMKIGLAFQIADDILDIEGSSEQLGKTAGKDIMQGKMTYPALVGLEKSREIAAGLAEQGCAALEQFGQKADTLRKLAKALLHRTK